MKKAKDELKGYIRAAAKGGRADTAVDSGLIGISKLDKIRSVVRKERLNQVHDQSQMRDLQMSLVNDYLNSYTDKLQV